MIGVVIFLIVVVAILGTLIYGVQQAKKNRQEEEGLTEDTVEKLQILGIIEFKEILEKEKHNNAIAKPNKLIIDILNDLNKTDG